MADALVYFATNRAKTGVASTANPIFGIDVMPFTQESPVYSAVPVTGIDLNDADSGSIGTMRPFNGGRFSDAITAELEAAGKNVIVFIHGMANTFDDSIKRAAFLQAWFASSSIEGSDTTVIAFSWPSDGFIVSKPPASPTTAYHRDQLAAADSDVHLIRFLNEIARIYGTRPANKRLTLLVHSMGNFVLGGAVEKWALLGSPIVSPLFNQAILPAADEINTTFNPGNGIRLAHLDTLASRIAIYSNRDDAAMELSLIVNQVVRLGYNGPLDKLNPTSFPRDKFDLGDCTDVDDYDWYNPVSSHQYYRRSFTVRDDIAALIAGVEPKPGTRTYAAPESAVYTLGAPST